MMAIPSEVQGLAGFGLGCYRLRMSAPPMDLDDAALVQAMGRGDENALAQLYDRYGGLLMAVGTRILGSSREAEDLLHDVFLEVWRVARDYNPSRGTVRTWLTLRMRSRALDRLRAAGRAKVVLENDPEKSSEPVDRRDLSEVPDRTVVREALAALSSDQRAVLELSYFEGLSSSEISRRLDIPLGTVKSRIGRGLEALRKHLGVSKGGASS